MNRRKFIHILLVSLAGCAVPPARTQAPPPLTRLPPTASPAACQLEPLVAPTRPAAPPNGQRDDVGLHVINSRAVEIDPLGYRLKIGGLVASPKQFSLDELRCMPKISDRPELTCPENFTDVTTWAGVPLRYVLALAGGLLPQARQVVLVGGDGYSHALPPAGALAEDSYLAYEWQSQPLPILHGFPLRAVIPGQYGNYWVKFLVEIRAE